MRREETVDYNIKATWHAIARMYNQQAARYGATMSTGFVLLNVDAEEGTPATKIAPLMGLEARSLTRILKTMESDGLIFRAQDPNDRRSVRIFLTPEGRGKKEKAREVVLHFNNTVLQQVAPEKLKAFFEVLSEINKVVERPDLFDGINT
ncbi:MAG: MarR family transcriptional regulator [Cyclobacteriaceae bacterium]|jgi:DNA-binding MarR family transcriptional regulator|nr:MarR family transcriptional regulator [Cyclobacteriaceae bacterium]